jgi:hypothetical protein
LSLLFCPQPFGAVVLFTAIWACYYCPQPFEPVVLFSAIWVC